jgi:hypothetical protein
MKLKHPETIIDCFPSDSAHDQPGCHDCGKAPYQTVVLSFAGMIQKVPLCGGHFINAWADYPELRKLDPLFRLRGTQGMPEER